MAIEKEVKVVVSAVDQYSEGMLGFNTLAGGVVLAVGAMAAALVAASVEAAKFAVTLGVDVFKSASDFHDAMYNVEAVAASFGTTGSDIDKILDNLTTKFPITGAQAGEALQLIAQLGLGAKDELASMADAANVLQIATGADLQTAIAGTVGVMNAWNLEANEAERITNLFAATSFSSSASVEDLATAMRYAGSMAALSGISVEETAAMIGKLRDRGLEASQAGTTLRMGLAQLLKETEKGTAVLAKYGLTYADVNPEVHSLTEIIGAFEGQQLGAKDAVDLFGIRASVMAGVVNDGAEAFGGYVQSVTGTTAAIDAMNKKAETWTVVQNQIIGSTDQFKKAIAGDLIPEILHLLGTNENEGLRGVIVYLTLLEKNFGYLGDALRGGFEGVTDVLDNVFSSSFGNVSELYDYISLLALGFSENLKIVAEWGGVWAGIGIESTNSMDMIKFGLHAINSAFAGLSLAVALVHDAFAVAFNAWLWALSNLQTGWIDLKTLVAEVVLAIAEAMNELPFVNMEDSIAGLQEKIAEYGVEAKKAMDPAYVNLWSDDVAKAYYRTAEGIVALKKPAEEVREVLKFDNTNIAQTVQGFKDAQEAAGIATKDAHDFLNEINSLDPTNIKTVTQSTKEMGEATGKLVTDVVLVNDKWETYTTRVGSAKTATVDLNKQISEMTDQEFKLYTEKFKSDLELVAQKSKETHETIMANIEWQAKLDIAEVEANAERVVAAFESIAESVVATSEASSSMLSEFADFEGSMSDKWYIQRILDDQMDLQRDALDIQRDLADAEIALTKAKTDRINSLSDEAMITVNGDGLKPHLEMIMWEIFEQIQIRATQEGLDKLLLGP